MPELQTPETQHEDPPEDNREVTQQNQSEPKKAQSLPEKPVVPDQPKQPPQEPERPKEPETTDGVEQSIWSVSRNKVRTPMQRLLKLGMFAANPIVYGSVLVGDKLLRKTPVVKHAYSVPREVVRFSAAKTRDAMSATITSPALALDIGGNVYQGIKGKTKKESRGLIGRAFELAAESVGKLGRSILKLGPPLKNAVIGTAKIGTTAVGGVFKGTADIIKNINGALKKIPIIGPFMPIATTAAVVFGGHAVIAASLPYLPSSLAVGYENLIQYIANAWKSIF